ncbi:MAG: class I SAM-dependent methyltransferase [Rhabdochlamydiaceae bacterium]|jgi:SAM-dependent methyltransferase
MNHKSAKPSHYDKESEYYDSFIEKSSQDTNQLIENILKKYKVKTVLDLTCGTGSQVFYLAKRGYKVTGSDFNLKMLNIAKSKARKEKLDIKFLQGDMRTQNAGRFDAVITIFNAVGHLTKRGFEKAMRNIGENLKDGGLYVFDINNLAYLLKDNQITNLTMDRQVMTDDTKIRETQYSTIDEDGILASYTIYSEQKGSNKPKIFKSSQTLQVYSAKQLREMLQKNGFKVLSQYGIDGSKFDEFKSDRILTIAQKISG